MSRFTTEVRYICEVNAGLTESKGFGQIQEIIQKAIPGVFNFNFPIFDENYRNVLETKILTHFYTREIAFETVGMWQLKLYTKLNEIMPYYNQLYKSELYEYNPLYDVDLKRVHNVKANGTENKTGTEQRNTNNTEHTMTDGTSKNTNTVTGKQFMSDTPQGALTDIEAGRYMTQANINNDSIVNDGTMGSTSDHDFNSDATGNTSENRAFNNTEDYLESVQGKQGSGSYSDMILRFRETFLNIDMLIIDELEELFFQLWD